MMLASEIATEVTSGVAVASTPEGLGMIKHPGCPAVIWRRQPLPSFQSWLDALEPRCLPSARLVLRPTRVREALLQICDIAGTPEQQERDRLIDDTAALADMFAGLMKVPYLQLRFDVIKTNACRKFHVDTVTARLICTYRGTGTQYGISSKGTEPRRVFTVPTGAPILLRGKLWPESPKSRLLHRSPPIEGTGETRLVLVLDPIAEPDSEMNQQFMH